MCPVLPIFVRNSIGLNLESNETMSEQTKLLKTCEVGRQKHQ
eukprot:SAG31_NODE_116_length_24094_cov_38.884184_5_plen_42_part_00